MSRVLDVLLRRRAAPHWDPLIRGALVVGLTVLAPAMLWREVAALTGFFLVTAFVNGPLAPLLPATYEPILMAAGRVWPPLVVAAVGIAGILSVEYANYYLYRAAILHPRLEPARASRLVQRTVALFARYPFFTVWLCAWSPLPYWAVRVLAPLAGYPVGRYLLATFLGRAPRVWFFAALGLVVPASTFLLVGSAVLMIVVAVAIAAGRTLRPGRSGTDRGGIPGGSARASTPA